MKRKTGIVAILLCIMQIFCVGCGYTNTDEGVLRLCVTADAPNGSADAVAMQTATAVRVYMADVLQGVNAYASARAVTDRQKSNIAQIATSVLRRNGCGYAVTVDWKEGAGGVQLHVRLGCGVGADTSATLFPCGDVAPSDTLVYKSLLAEWLGK